MKLSMSVCHLYKGCLCRCVTYIKGVSIWHYLCRCHIYEVCLCMTLSISVSQIWSVSPYDTIYVGVTYIKCASIWHYLCRCHIYEVCLCITLSISVSHIWSVSHMTLSMSVSHVLSVSLYDTFYVSVTYMKCVSIWHYLCRCHIYEVCLCMTLSMSVSHIWSVSLYDTI